ncbi:hypothetical protein IWQ60_002383 [Tieghemiomyces parasiticus]|uniref:Dopey N-terminal domain-containing protein n=1 Tax=Tieghemiomyces parasiticus TaxID=78921 RepID=A0A9W8ABD8_9FUNG|nr:hypothetical protein IWQ60_002383 [Tieghemiomyces parasiticus]
MQDHAADPKYAKYAQLVERCLQSFDYISEWADVTAFLAKLTKAFQTYPQFAVIPAKETVAKRLAQCLNPALPTGVHQKTLELYAFILQKIGTDQLAEDLPLYSYGLFPFLKHAAMSAKPSLLTIYEVHYLPLKTRLRACVKGLTLALLPGLEEEGNEFFDQTLRLLDAVSHGVEAPYFYQALFLGLITAPDLRTAALHYLSRRLPRSTQREDMAFVVGDDPTLLVHALAASLRDSQPLVQRATLDLLVAHLPLAADLVAGDDAPLLLAAAAEVVLRRDMSLNRRLYAWLLGPSETRADRQVHFSSRVQRPLVKALRAMLATTDPDDAVRQRPFRILVSLLDRSEIGVPLVRALVPDTVTAARRYHATSLQSTRPAVRMLFETVDPYLVWSWALGTVGRTLDDPLAAADPWPGLTFLVGELYARDAETRAVHAPLVVAGTLGFLADRLETEVPPPEQVTGILTWLHDLLALAAPTTLVAELDAIHGLLPAVPEQTSPDATRPANGNPTTHSLTAAVGRFYSVTNTSWTDGPDTEVEVAPPLPRDQVRRALDGLIAAIPAPPTAVTLADGLRAALAPVLVAYRDHPATHPATARLYAALDTSGPPRDSARLARCCPTLLPRLLATVRRTNDPATAAGHLAWALDAVAAGSLPSTALSADTPLDALVSALWRFLAPAYASHHVAVVQALVRLGEVVGVDRLEAALRSCLAAPGPGREREAALACFAAFWAHASDPEPDRPAYARLALLALDPLSDEGAGALYRAAEAWVRDQVGHPARLATALLNLLAQDPSGHCEADAEGLIYRQPVNGAQLGYALDQTRRFCSTAGAPLLDWLLRTPLTPRLCHSLAGAHAWRPAAELVTYYDAYLELALRYAVARGDGHTRVRPAALRLTTALVTLAPHIPPSISVGAADVVVAALNGSVTRADLDPQPDLLRLLLALWAAPPHFGPTDRSPAEAARQLAAVNLDRTVSGGNRLALAALYRPTAGEAVVAVTPGPTSSTASTASTSGPLLTRTLLDALSRPANRCVLRSWVDFLGLALAHFRPAFGRTLWPAAVLLCLLLKEARSDLRLTCPALTLSPPTGAPAAPFSFLPPPQGNSAASPPIRSDSTAPDRLTPAPAARVLTYLDGLEHLLLFSLTDPTVSDDAPSPVPPGWLQAGVYDALTARRGTKGRSGSLVATAALGPVDPEVTADAPGTRAPAPGRSTSSGGLRFLADAVATVFSTGPDPSAGANTTASSATPSVPARAVVLAELPSILRVLLDLTAPTKSPDPPADAAVVVRVHSLVARLAAVAPTAVFESAVETWFRDNRGADWTAPLARKDERQLPENDEKDHYGLDDALREQGDEEPATSARPPQRNRAVELLHTVSGFTPAVILGLALDAAAVRGLGDVPPHLQPPLPIPPSETPYYTATSPHLTDLALGRFAMAYLATTAFDDAGALREVLPRILAYTRFLLASPPHPQRAARVAGLRVLTAFLRQCRPHPTVLQTPDGVALHEAYYRLTDASIVLAGRLLDGSARGEAAASATEPVPSFRTSDAQLAGDLLALLADPIMTLGPAIVPEPERLQSLAAAVVNHIAGPFLRGRWPLAPVLVVRGRPVHPDRAPAALALPYLLAHRVVALLAALARHPTTLLRSYRREVWDHFADAPGFFVQYGMTRRVLGHWRRLVGTVAAAERTRLGDLLTRISAAPASHLFANREAETVAQALLVRKLAFILYSGACDQYTAVLPGIQEKLVDLLKLPRLPALVHVEVYLCLRVLLRRVTGRYLATLWPVLLTDLLRLCSRVLATDMTAPADLAARFLAACKFLDLLLVLAPAEFQLHQWIFVTDTMEALYGARRTGVALIDRMSAELDVFSAGSPTWPTSIQDYLPSGPTPPRRRPLLTMGAIRSLRDLEPFVHNISVYAYEATYALACPDLPFIEARLADDLLFTTIYDTEPAGTAVLNDAVAGP